MRNGKNQLSNYLCGEWKEGKNGEKGKVFTVKSYLGKKKTKAHMAKNNICQIWVVVYRCLL